MRVMVVEDDNLIAADISHQLQDLGFVVASIQAQLKRCWIKQKRIVLS